MNSYERPSPDPAPKPNRHWGLDQSVTFYSLVRVGREIITKGNWISEKYGLEQDR